MEELVSLNPDLRFRNDDKALFPLFHVMALKDRLQQADQSGTTWILKPDQQKASVLSWLELSRVRKIQILGNQQSFFLLASSPNPFIRTTYQRLIDDSMDVMSDRSELGP